MTNEGVKRRYGRYNLATALYVLGVVVVCSWSYMDQRQDVMKRLDAALVHASHAVREIVEDGCAEHLARIDSADAPLYSIRQAQLGRLAQKSGLALLGAAVHEGGDTYVLVAESGNPAIIPFGDVKYGDSLPLSVKRNVLDLVGSSDEDAALINIDHVDYGLFRMAVLINGHPDGTVSVYFAAQQFKAAKSQLYWFAQREAAAGLFLIITALVMVRLRNTIEKRAAHELAVLNDRLKRDLEMKQQRQNELEANIQDLERFSAVATGREGRILQLKAEINNLLEQLNREKRYNSAQTD